MLSIWIVGINTFGKNKSFYTSDNPVAKNHPLYGTANKGVEISFPLNSEIVLILLGREEYKHYKVFENKIMQLTAEQIDCCNAMQVISSDRQVYCRQDDFKLVKRTIENSAFNLSSKRKRF